MTDPERTAEDAPSDNPRPKAPTSNPVLAKILRYGGIFTSGIALVGAVLGGIFAGGQGVAGALVGAVMAGVFVAVTAVSILVANRFIGNEFFGALFFAIVLGGWILKFIVFIVLFLLLNDQPWLNGTVMFVTLVAAVVASLVIDVVVVSTSRLGYVSDTRIPDAAEDA